MSEATASPSTAARGNKAEFGHQKLQDMNKNGIYAVCISYVISSPFHPEFAKGQVFCAKLPRTSSAAVEV